MECLAVVVLGCLSVDLDLNLGLDLGLELELELGLILFVSGSVQRRFQRS